MYVFKEGVDIDELVKDRLHLVGNKYVLNGSFVDDFISVNLDDGVILQEGFDHIIKEWYEMGVIDIWHVCKGCGNNIRYTDKSYTCERCGYIYDYDEPSEYIDSDIPF